MRGLDEHVLVVMASFFLPHKRLVKENAILPHASEGVCKGEHDIEGRSMYYGIFFQSVICFLLSGERSDSQ